MLGVIQCAGGNESKVKLAIDNQPGIFHSAASGLCSAGVTLNIFGDDARKCSAERIIHTSHRTCTNRQVFLCKSATANTKHHCENNKCSNDLLHLINPPLILLEFLSERNKCDDCDTNKVCPN